MDTIAEDRLRGLTEIADFLGEPERRATYLLETGQIPGGKLGGTWLASKTALLRHYEEITSRAEPRGRVGAWREAARVEAEGRAAMKAAARAQRAVGIALTQDGQIDTRGRRLGTRLVNGKEVVPDEGTSA